MGPSKLISFFESGLFLLYPRGKFKVRKIWPKLYWGEGFLKFTPSLSWICTLNALGTVLRSDFHVLLGNSSVYFIKHFWEMLRKIVWKWSNKCFINNLYPLTTKWLANFALNCRAQFVLTTIIHSASSLELCSSLERQEWGISIDVYKFKWKYREQ